ncbi:MAG: hypothetical protein A3H97_04815 [Acidobacteria bacterium RIFCSPLOWO2_02_FULL_65_29]|nr:MAG: hypothetical protein A3H97_04815 [Acidobacteria bacterium RIFCSPLOWO2_02_FULL_65_29]
MAPTIALSAIAAPEHVHEADADHHHSTVHRHVQLYAVGSHDHDDGQLADDDGQVVWLDGVMLHRPAYQFAAPAAPPAERSELALTVTVWVAAPDYNAAPPHGPPRACLSLRAPPSCLS